MARGATKSGAAGEDARSWRPPRFFSVITWIAVGVVAAGLALWLAKRQAQAPARQVTPPPTGLPHTPDYHSLLVSPVDPRRIVLGTHAGLYESVDGGRSWRKGALGGKDTMNLVRTRSGRLWAAGHNILFASGDGGRTWNEVRPRGLPGLDLHGFAAAKDGTLYAAVAHKGLYRSRDGGRTFSFVTEQVGGNVLGLAVLATGRILAADPKRGVFASEDGGRSWRTVLRAPAVGLAVNSARAAVILATGDAIRLSEDGGRTWRKVLGPAAGAGPVAWSLSSPTVAYAVGFDRRLYRSRDGGATWRPVA